MTALSEPAVPLDGRLRVVIENPTPCVDGGRFAAKRTLGETLVVQADVFTDGHDAVRCQLLYRHESQSQWQHAAMEALGNDRWQGHFEPTQLGRWLFAVEGWVDEIGTWQHQLLARATAGQPLAAELLRGAQLLLEAARRAASEHASRLRGWSALLADVNRSAEERLEAARDRELLAIAQAYPEAALRRRLEPPLAVQVERVRARFSSWYELFPRSCGPAAHIHGTLADCEQRLPYVARLGFDVLYLPPIHPIGRTDRRGPNNQPTAGPADPGSPWAIGSSAGGHKAIDPQLGTLADFRRLVARAGSLGIEIALDIAFQCSPDHPYVREHPNWFLRRPDGTIQFAENPPKKYPDIFPFDFGCADWQGLWHELASVVQFWIDQGVRIFRVDNPHTKPFAFWEWLIARTRSSCPEVIFLAEAFTRPKLMYRLAKLGFSQSYNYFPWRNTREELTRYFTELTATPVSDFFRPNLWPNTPDILTEYLQYGGRAAFMIRLVLAATLGASYGIYGPAFELMEHEPREPGSEEYRDSEKYQLRHWNLDRPDSLADLITRLNAIRREQLALQSDGGLRFHATDNPALLAYSKQAAGEDAVVSVVNLDPHHVQSGWLDLDLASLGVERDRLFQAHDLLSGARFLWKGARNYIALDPDSNPAHILRIRRHVRTERDFDYFL